jgi:putative flippase GtrA
MNGSSGTGEIMTKNLEHELPLVSLQEPIENLDGGWLSRLFSYIPPGQFLHYLCVGVFNTVFGYATSAGALFLLNHFVAQRYLSLTVIAASLITFPLNITVAYLGYKIFVFHTRGNYLREWLRCFAVYGTVMIPGLLALGALTRFFQSYLHLTRSAGYLALALLTGITAIFSFVGHKKVTFRPRPTA